MASRTALLWCIFSLVPSGIVAAADLASPASYEGRAIAAIRFDPPVQPVAEQDLQRMELFHPGEPLRLTDVRDAIKRLYATGAYSDVEVDSEPAPNGVVLVIRTTDQWFIGPVEVHGKINFPPNRGQLANATQLQLGAPFDDSQIQTAAQGIRSLLERNGLYLATITPQVQRDSEHQEVALTFQVNSGKRARLTTPSVSGDTKIGAEAVAKAAKYKGWFRWKPATQENVQSGLQNIRKKYEKQKRLTASVELDHSDYIAEGNRVKPDIQADGGPKVEFKTTGAKLSSGKLHEYVPVFDEETVNRDLLVSGARNLRDYFQNQGYFDAEVDFREATPSPDLEQITYVVGLGQRRKLVKVALEGNRYFATPDLRDLMFLQPAGFIRLRHGRYSESFAERDESSIEAMYQANGFRDAKVTDTVTDNYRGKKGDVAVTLHIDEGPQYTVSKLRIDGMTIPGHEQLVKQLASIDGQPFSETNVAMDRDAILQFYQSSGYLNAEFNWRMTPGPGPHQIQVQYTITEGRPNYVRRILFFGLHTTRRRLVDPAVRLKAGDPLSWTEMGATQRRLYNLGVFDKVDMAVQDPDGTERDKYVLYHFTEGHLYNLALGFGAEIANIGGSQTSLNNPAGTAGFAPRVDLELSRLNLWGLGHSINFKGRYSTLDRRVSLNYLAPRFRNVDGRNISVTAMYDNIRDVLTYTAVRYTGSIQMSQRMSKAVTMLFRYSWTDDRVDASTLKINPGLIPLYSQPVSVGMLSANWIQDRRDDPTDAHRGWYNTLNLDYAAVPLGGDKNFLRFLGRSAYYKKIGAHNVLASNTEFGVIRGYHIPANISPFDYIPLPERFFGGGSESMRGFPENQAGPRDLLTGFPIGGNALFFHQTEFRFPLIGDNIDGVFFHDMGNIYSTVSNISFRFHQNGLTDFNYMVQAPGFGIRYRTPLGPLRLDFAYSINPPTFNGLKGTYQQLLFGGATPAVQSVSHFQFFISIGQAF
jgi:outer membrane protein assembly complex protein YaeT